MPPPDLILLADRIHLLGDAAPVSALLIRCGRVAAAGSPEQVRALAGPGARAEHLPGAVVTPGLTDAHVHLTTWGLGLRRVDLNAAPTLQAGLAAVASAPGDGWVRGIGWDVHRWGRLPTRQELDPVCPARPAFLQSHDIHGAWLNSEALRRCGITRDTPDPAGGTIVRDSAGEPTGVLLERAVALAERHLPADTPAEIREALLEAQRALHGLGVTGVHSVEVNGLEDFTALAAEDRLRLRVLQAIQVARLDAAIEVGLRGGFGGEWIRIGGVKMFLDGALGSRTAWLREPYEGTADDRGIRTLPADEFRDAVERAAAAGLSSTVHAIGDAAVELALDVLGATPAPPAHAAPHRAPAALSPRPVGACRPVGRGRLGAAGPSHDRHSRGGAALGARAQPRSLSLRRGGARGDDARVRLRRAGGEL